ncbi:hypothetical protein FOA52_009151 [Chlamydomonas sp. UWO 241]|nr:hypothetical protein FOA52_009151 [Chlamydomonas sp. UWO 241]
MAAVWRPTPGQHVQLHALKAKQHNATLGVVLGPETSPEAADCWAAAERVPVRRADQAQLMCVKAANLRPAPFIVQPVTSSGVKIVGGSRPDAANGGPTGLTGCCCSVSDSGSWRIGYVADLP